MWISKRDSEILRCLLKIYISTHRPVSSNQLVPFLSLSSSSIRKELQNLESRGFITKANISSGRIPTNKAIKFYLKELTSDLDINKNAVNMPEINDFDFTSISDNFLSLLSSQSHNIGFIFLNSIFDLNFKKVNLIKVAPHRIMIIIQSLNHWTFSKIFRTNKNYPEIDLNNWEHILNKEFKGKTLNNTLKIVRNRLFKEKEKYIKIYKELYFLFGNEDLITAELFYKGTLNILDSDLIDPSKVKRVIETLEDKVKLSSFLNDILRNNKK